jgi:hypothetical protein
MLPDTVAKDMDARQLVKTEEIVCDKHQRIEAVQV